MASLIPIFSLVTGLRITKDDVSIRAEYVRKEDDYGYYHEDYYNLDEKTFLEVLKTLGVDFKQTPRNKGAELEHFYADEISWIWFRRRFVEVQKANGRKTVCGFPDAKSAFLFGVLTSCSTRVVLFQTTDNRHFWRLIKILEKTK